MYASRSGLGNALLQVFFYGVVEHTSSAHSALFFVANKFIVKLESVSAKLDCCDDTDDVIVAVY